MIGRVFRQSRVNSLLTHCEWSSGKLPNASFPLRSFAKKVKPKTMSKSASVRYSGHDEPDLCDMTTIPAGMELYNSLVFQPKRAPIHFEVTLDQPNPTKLGGFHVIAMNVPHGATEENVRNALQTCGRPSEVMFFESFVPKSSTKRSVRLDSRRYAILRFESQEEFEKVTRIEAKLFGVLCKSSGSPPDSPRTMFMESAETRHSLLVTNMKPETTVEELKHDLVTSMKAADFDVNSWSASIDGNEEVADRYAILKLGSFPAAFKILQYIQASKAPNFNLALSTFRSIWKEAEGKFVEVPILSSYDP
jgi:hypothetical protein